MNEIWLSKWMQNHSIWFLFIWRERNIRTRIKVRESLIYQENSTVEPRNSVPRNNDFLPLTDFLSNIMNTYTVTRNSGFLPADRKESLFRGSTVLLPKNNTKANSKGWKSVFVPKIIIQKERNNLNVQVIGLPSGCQSNVARYRIFMVRSRGY